MSNRSEITKMLSLSLEKYINPHNDTRIYWAREVTFDHATGHAVRVDYMKFKPINNTVSGIEKGDFYCYEVKSSVEDFHSGHGLNFLGDYNYVVMPEEVFEVVSNEIPYYVGVIVPDGKNWRGNWYDLKSVKKARRRNRGKPEMTEDGMITPAYSDYSSRKIIERLAEYEDAEEQGLFLRMSHKVGDTVYFWYADDMPYKARELIVRTLRDFVETMEGAEFGKIVFLPRKEAVAKLEELSNENEADVYI